MTLKIALWRERIDMPGSLNDVRQASIVAAIVSNLFKSFSIQSPAPMQAGAASSGFEPSAQPVKASGDSSAEEEEIGGGPW